MSVSQSLLLNSIKFEARCLNNRPEKFTLLSLTSSSGVETWPVVWKAVNRNITRSGPRPIHNSLACTLLLIDLFYANSKLEWGSTLLCANTCICLAKLLVGKANIKTQKKHISFIWQLQVFFDTKFWKNANKAWVKLEPWVQNMSKWYCSKVSSCW